MEVTTQGTSSLYPQMTLGNNSSRQATLEYGPSDILGGYTPQSTMDSALLSKL
ncbi:hypothetical protein SK128_025144, partial [Halocaridina rubra]